MVALNTEFSSQEKPPGENYENMYVKRQIIKLEWDVDIID